MRVMRKSYKDSLKALEADIQHANTLYCLFSNCVLRFFLFSSWYGVMEVGREFVLYTLLFSLTLLG